MSSNKLTEEQIEKCVKKHFPKAIRFKGVMYNTFWDLKYKKGYCKQCYVGTNPNGDCIDLYEFATLKTPVKCLEDVEKYLVSVKETIKTERETKDVAKALELFRKMKKGYDELGDAGKQWFQAEYRKEPFVFEKGE